MNEIDLDQPVRVTPELATASRSWTVARDKLSQARALVDGQRVPADQRRAR
jgi:hypothetical protein